MNPFEILKISPTKDKMEIRRAYVRELKKRHPDQGGQNDDCRQLHQAYDQLVKTNNKKNPIKTVARLSLADFLYGCVATVSFTDGVKIRFVEFTVQPFTYPGDTVVFQDKDTGKYIEVTVYETPSLDYKRLEHIIIINRNISVHQAQAGTSITVQNFDGYEHTVNIPPNTSASRLIYTFPQAGFFDRKTHDRGHLSIIIEVVKDITNV